MYKVIMDQMWFVEAIPWQSRLIISGQNKNGKQIVVEINNLGIIYIVNFAIHLWKFIDHQQAQIERVIDAMKGK